MFSPAWLALVGGLLVIVGGVLIGSVDKDGLTGAVEGEGRRLGNLGCSIAFGGLMLIAAAISIWIVR